MNSPVRLPVLWRRLTTNIRLSPHRFLRHPSLKIRYADAILGETFRTTTWVPPASDDAKLVDNGRFVERGIGRRALSDTVEATLGAAYFTGGFPMALETGVKLGLCFGGEKPLGEREGAHGMGGTPGGSAPGLKAVEYKLGYRFKDSRLLLQALTHQSYVAASMHCYEREEHLGDGVFVPTPGKKANTDEQIHLAAVLDFWATDRLFKLFPSSTPRVLTVLRSLLVNNTTLAFLSVRKLSLHLALLHGSGALDVAIRLAVAEIETSSEDGEDRPEPNAFTMARVIHDLSWTWDPPKLSATSSSPFWGL